MVRLHETCSIYFCNFRPHFSCSEIMIIVSLMRNIPLIVPQLP